jgi:hypothetical protein
LNRHAMVGALALAFLAPSAQAAVASASDTAFIVKLELTVSAAPNQAYARLIEWGKWWSSEHSFSGSADNFSLKVEPGGCLCEAMPNGGFVQHSTVVVAIPGKTLQLTGALGPLLMMGGSTSLTVRFVPEGQGTKLLLTLVGRGYEPDKGLKDLAKAYDGVLTEQFTRYKRYVEKE